jgi:hypothetical protein
MKTKTKTNRPHAWYEKIFKNVALINRNPELAPYLNKETFSPYHTNVARKLINQSRPLTPSKDLEMPTPEKVGLLLGQFCANIYALKDPQTLQVLEQERQELKLLRTQSHIPGVRSRLHEARVNRMMSDQFEKELPRLKEKIQAGLQAALDQPNRQEAAEFYDGFARGLAKPGLKHGKLAGHTEATPLQMKMFMHWEEAANMKSVEEWRAFLLKHGETEETLGDPERLKKFCNRVGYAPGKKAA